VTLSLTVTADGRAAHLQIQPITRLDKKIRIFVHTDSLARAGFAVPPTAKNGLLEISSGASVAITFPRTTP